MVQKRNQTYQVQPGEQLQGRVWCVIACGIDDKGPTTPDVHVPATPNNVQAEAVLVVTDRVIATCVPEISKNLLFYIYNWREHRTKNHRTKRLWCAGIEQPVCSLSCVCLFFLRTYALSTLEAWKGILPSAG
jgi:hypothetical protein